MKNRTKWLVGALVVVLLVGAGVVLANPELYKGITRFQPRVETVRTPVAPETVREETSISLTELEKKVKSEDGLNIGGAKFDLGDLSIDLENHGIDLDKISLKYDSDMNINIDNLVKKEVLNRKRITSAEDSICTLTIGGETWQFMPTFLDERGNLHGLSYCYR